MFDLCADEIVYDNRTIARLVPGLPATFIDAVELDLCAGPEAKGWVSEEEHSKALSEAEEAGYDRGKAQGELEAQREAEGAFADELAQAKLDAFAEGRKAGAADAGKAAELARVDALLARVALAEAKLRQALNGIREEGSYKSRTLKVTEFKQVIRTCYLELGQAKREVGMTMAA